MIEGIIATIIGGVTVVAIVWAWSRIAAALRWFLRAAWRLLRGIARLGIIVAPNAVNEPAAGQPVEVERAEGESSASVAERPGIAVVATKARDGWAHLDVTNEAPVHVKYQALVEIQDGTGRAEAPYHPPWRQNEEHYLTIDAGDLGTVNFAEVTPARREGFLNEAIRRRRYIVQFFSTDGVGGSFVREVPGRTEIRATIRVISDLGPPQQIEAKLRIGGQGEVTFAEASDS